MNTEIWGIVEVMGHSRYAGRISEYTGLGVPLLRVEVPKTEDEPAFEKLLAAASIFRITPCSEEVARAAAVSFRVRPLELIQLPSFSQQRQLPLGVDPEDDDPEDWSDA